MNPDTMLQRYTIGKKIGTGGMASVFLARDTVLNRDVAIKMVHPHLLQNAETLRRFSTEAQAIAALSHDNIIKIYDYGKSGDLPFIVMEYVEGCTLETLLERERPLPSLVTLEIARQTLSGLICAHDKGIYHRDIKPGNILVDGEGRLRITDFGIAYLVNTESVTMTGSFLGSPHFIAPEQVSNRKVSGVTDVFSLGIVLYQCLTGIFPFDADTPHGIINAILTAEPPAPAVVNRQLLLWLSDAVETFLEKDPVRRPSPREAFDRLEAASRADALQCTRARLADFMKNARQVRDEESHELSTHYCSRAHRAIKERQLPAALRHFEQAGRFRALSAEDEKLVARISRQSAARRAVLTVAVVAIVAGLLFALASLIANRRPVTRKTIVLSGVSSVPKADSASSNGDADRQVSDSPAVPVRPVEASGELPHPESAQVRVRPPSAPDTQLSAATTKPMRQPKVDSAPADIRSVQTASPKPGFLTCFTNPPWAALSIDGIERGKTPTLAAIPLSSGKHAVRLSRLNFADYADSIAVAPAETSHVRVKLVPQPQGGAAQ